MENPNEQPTVITENEKWQAVVNCDKGYDSLFLYGVKTTAIFCRPSCRSKAPLRNNVTFFINAQEAMESGFRPCKRCRPDKLVYQPDLELIKRVKNMLDADYNQQIEVSQIAKQLGLSTTHLTRVFKQHYGLTPTQFITKRRVEKATELLLQTDTSILDVSYTVGFKSLSNFYKTFKEQTGYTPKEYRSKKQVVNWR